MACPLNSRIDQRFPALACSADFGRLVRACGAALLLLTGTSCSEPEGEPGLFAPPSPIEAGAALPDLAELDREAEVSLDKPVTVLVVLSTECAATRSCLSRLMDFHKRREREVNLVALNVGPQDDLAAWRAERRLAFPLINDTELAVSRALGASRTPTFFVFGEDRRLLYQGPLDDSPLVPSQVRERLLDQAVDAALGKGTAPASRPAVGRPIDWLAHHE